MNRDEDAKNTLAIRLMALLRDRGIISDDDYGNLLFPDESEIERALADIRIISAK